MKENFLNANVFPFAFQPENLASRKVLKNTLTKLEVEYNMADFEEKIIPQCAAVALKSPNPLGFGEQKICFDVQIEGGLVVNMELKTGPNKDKVYDEPISTGKLEFDIPENTTEIVFAVWKYENNGKKGTLSLEVL